MDDNSLLGGQVVIQTILTTSRFLNFTTEGERVKIEQLEHFISISLIVLNSEESRLEAVIEDGSHGAETSTLDTVAAGNEVLAEDRAGERDVAKDLAMHHI